MFLLHTIDNMRQDFYPAVESFEVICFDRHRQVAFVNLTGPAVRKEDSAIHRIVIFSTVVKMLENYETTDI